MPRSNSHEDEPLHRQAGRVRTGVLLALAHKGVPWALFLLLTICGNVLRLVIGHVAPGWEGIPLTSGLVAAMGLTLAGLDWHLRGHRLSAVGRAIGPVTITAATVMTTVFLVAGYPVPLDLLWLFGGTAACIGWDMWLVHGEKHDLTSRFSAAALESGLGAARIIPSRQPRALPAARAGSPARPPAPQPQRPGRSRPGKGRMTATIAFEGGRTTPAEASAELTRLEGALHYPPGAVSLSPNQDDAAMSDAVFSDPRSLAHPMPWPGPSAPGGPVSAPFRMGLRQDGLDFAPLLVPVYLTRTTGQTGSGKTMSYLWNRLAEGVTRPGYAAFGFDLTKRWQYFGPVRDGMHGVAVEVEAALRLLAGLERVRVARMDYMEKRNITEWSDDCGLSYLDISMEELGEILTMLVDASKSSGRKLFDFGTWLTNVRAGRSGGMSWNVSNQTGGYKSFPTEARGSFSPVTFGLTDTNDVKTALSGRQSAAACRPQMWGTSRPGMAFADLPTMDEGDFSMPVRFYSWGRDGSLIADYMRQWPASDRPLDDISAEALASEPSLPASYALPGPGGTLAGTTVPQQRPALDPRAARPGSNVRPLFAPPPPDRYDEAAQAEQDVMDFLAGWHREGKTDFTSIDLQKAGLHERLGKSRSWLYDMCDIAEQKGLTEVIALKPKKRWKILPPAQADSEEM
jgi:hypothetical protein